MTNKGVDYIAPKDGKVVVTTTVSADQSTVHVASDVYAGAAASDLLGLQRLVGGSQISMLRLGPKTYLGLVSGRTQPRPLCIGDTLFLFVPRDQPLVGLAELVTDLAKQLPPDAPWRVSSDGAGFDVEQIAGLLKSRAQ